MKHLLKPVLIATLAVSARSHGADMQIDVTIPRIDTAEYHRPYVAVWIEDGQKKTIRDVAVWYEREKARDEGKQWLKDLRQWWRLSGRNQEHVADGVSGATRAVGVQTIRVSDQSRALTDLAPGDYQLVVEAAREKGGRELVRLPLPWPPTEASSRTAQGQSELGKIEVRLTP